MNKQEQILRILVPLLRIMYQIVELYDNSNFYLTRKFNKFGHYVNTEVTQLIAENRNALEVNVSNSNNPPKSPEHPTNEDEDVR